MACFDHFPILISQLVLRTYEDHDTWTLRADPAAVESHARHVAELNCQNCAVWTGAPFFLGLSSVDRADEQS